MKVKSSELVNTLANHLWEKYAIELDAAGKTDRFLKGRQCNPVFDHIMFRTVNAHTGEQPGGIAGIDHLAGFFGYRQIAKYSIHDKLLTAAVYQHEENSKLPRILVSQLEVSHLPGWAQKIIDGTVAETPYAISDNGIELLRVLGQQGSLPVEAGNFLLADLKGYFQRPWNPPLFSDVLKLSELSPYCAWVLLFGNSVAKFSVAVQSFGAGENCNLNQVCDDLKSAGISIQPIADLKGYENIRQAETLPEKTSVEAIDEDGVENIRWEYAGLHITERLKVNKDFKQEKEDWPLFRD